MVKLFEEFINENTTLWGKSFERGHNDTKRIEDNVIIRQFEIDRNEIISVKDFKKKKS